MSTLVALVSDLVFDSKLTAAAQAAGIDLHTERRPDKTLDRCADAAGLIVDLGALSPEEAVALVRTARAHHSGLRIVAFVSHVEAGLAAAARAAGADQVLSRSAFTSKLDAILRSLAGA